jgi:hypothetical protein
MNNNNVPPSLVRLANLYQASISLPIVVKHVNWIKPAPQIARPRGNEIHNKVIVYDWGRVTLTRRGRERPRELLLILEANLVRDDEEIEDGEKIENYIRPGWI